jgi:hypothetical protein
MRENPEQAVGLSWSQPRLVEFGVNSSDEGLRLAYEVRHGIDTAAGVEDYISRLERNVLHVQLNELLFTC